MTSHRTIPEHLSPRWCSGSFRSLPSGQFVITCFLAMALTGCIVIPHPTVQEELPFKDERIAFIEPGVTARQQIQQELGPPRVTRAEDRISLYAEAQTVAGMFFASIVSGTAVPIEKVHILVVQYGADDIVQSADVIRDDEGCTPDGICVKAVFDTQQAYGGWYEWEKVFDHAILFARPAEDAAAKSFPVYAEQCGIYLYETGDKAMIRIYGSGQWTTLPVDEEGYLYWISEPGPVTVRAATDPIEATVAASTEFELNCAPGGLYFLNAAYDSKLIGDDTLTFSIDGMETGKQLVNERGLIID